MRKFLSLALVLTLAVATAASAADEAKKTRKKGAKGKRDRVNIQALNAPKSIELTAEQKESVAELRKEYTPKFAELQKTLGPVLKARREAMKKAREDGKKGKELKEVAAAVNMTPEQKEAMEKYEALNKEVRAKFVALLTDEQKASLPGKKGNAKPKRKKKKDAA